ncbi:MAG TPA: RES family NAD+ phosphorylase [Gemmatimonadales bacterium]|nr:RES family NAD+ phosphorylase [Gemmatimonadales bacterium]
MRLYRICRAPYRALDGEGARLYGGRWNSPGAPVVYASSSLALAALEYLVHLDPDHAPSDLIALTLEVPDTASADVVHQAALPGDWAQVPEHPACVAAGDAWLGRGVTLLLRVPAAPVPEEQNVLINPRHVEAAQVRVIAERRFAFDPRLLP